MTEIGFALLVFTLLLAATLVGMVVRPESNKQSIRCRMIAGINSEAVPEEGRKISIHGRRRLSGWLVFWRIQN
ncbi:hypothetical protein ACP3TB_18575 (plasmid) [Rahnella variigena]|uniref:hypothetical protein n=1 Tax=Rahnella TaxID=34037 RepID=UPI000DD47D09|nr:MULTISPECIES: hypothetical protein [Rahnella]MDH2895852.1 hypothetical protein [Rahnella variigena]TCQ89579.1 hypothetical protein EC840_104487 [Rahnella sp. JUb53]